MVDKSPVIWWVRRELRLHDNPVLQACLDMGRPVIPVFILDEVFETYGACPLWRFGLGAEAFGETLGHGGQYRKVQYCYRNIQKMIILKGYLMHMELNILLGAALNLFSSFDNLSFYIHYTLFRYMSSKLKYI